MHIGLLRALRLLHRVVGLILPARAFSRSLPGIPGRVHIDDQMLASDAEQHVRHYLTDGLSAIANIEASLAVAGRTFSDVQACLDLPSGYGRVTRHLAARISPSRITASDIDRAAIRFCAAEFQVTPLLSKSDLRRITFPSNYDLIFVGSLLTHLPASTGIAVVEALASRLTPDGIVIFSTQGESCLEHLDWYGSRFAEAEGQYRAGMKQFGAWHLPYGRGTYGVTLHASEHLREALAHRLGEEFQLVRFAERGWDDHQDVWSYKRARQSSESRRAAEAQTS